MAGPLSKQAESLHTERSGHESASLICFFLSLGLNIKDQYSITYERRLCHLALSLLSTQLASLAARGPTTSKQTWPPPPSGCCQIFLDFLLSLPHAWYNQGKGSLCTGVQGFSLPFLSFCLAVCCLNVFFGYCLSLSPSGSDEYFFVVFRMKQIEIYQLRKIGLTGPLLFLPPSTHLLFWKQLSSVWETTLFPTLNSCALCARGACDSSLGNQSITLAWPQHLFQGSETSVIFFFSGLFSECSFPLDLSWEDGVLELLAGIFQLQGDSLLKNGASTQG